jgi:hypothetical protein
LGEDDDDLGNAILDIISSYRNSEYEEEWEDESKERKLEWWERVDICWDDGVSIEVVTSFDNILL